MLVPRWIASIVICAIACGIVPARAATSYSASVQWPGLGWMDQYSLDTAAYNYIGPQACVPTTATNALIYLQNSAPSVFGNSLTGSSYADWTAVDATLSSQGYMNTTLANGTYFRTIPYALTKFVVNDHGFDSVKFSGMFQPGFWTAQFPKPDFITNGVPTWNFLYNAFAAGAPVMLSVIYRNGDGHELLGSGLEWNDANSNGIIEFGEGAQLYFVDPLDPSLTYSGIQPGGIAKLSWGHLWYDSSIGELSLTYDQYLGDLPYDPSDHNSANVTINNAFVMAIPEPSTTMLLFFGAGIGGLMLVRRHSSAPSRSWATPSLRRDLQDFPGS